MRMTEQQMGIAKALEMVDKQIRFLTETLKTHDTAQAAVYDALRHVRDVYATCIADAISGEYQVAEQWLAAYRWAKNQVHTHSIRS
jgi:hypothetical protein